MSKLRLLVYIITLSGVWCLVGCGFDNNTGADRIEPPSGKSQDASQAVISQGEVSLEGDTCADGEITSFQDVKPILQANCVGCHADIATYAVVSEKLSTIINRLNLPANDSRRMPQRPATELSIAQKDLFQKFFDDGGQEKSVCRGADAKEFITLDYIEKEILDDLNRISSDVGQKGARYLILSHKLNSGASPEQMLTYVNAINMMVNSISSDKRITALTPIDPQNTIYRVDLTAYGLAAEDWTLIVSREPFQFTSSSRRGRQIAQLTGESQAWLHGDNFGRSAILDPSVYNHLLDIPPTLGELRARLGVNLGAAFSGDFAARLMGFNGSPITENKNRLVMRVDSSDGYFWQSFDTKSPLTPRRNLFDFPLINVGTRRFQFDASEIIFSLPNGLQGYALYNAAGRRENSAPADVVTNYRDQFDDIIDNGGDCMRCHSEGIIPVKDEVRKKAIDAGVAFDASDLELITTLYASTTANDALINTDQKKFAEAQKRIAIAPSSTDPVNVLIDEHRRDLTVADAAGFVFMSESDFCAKLTGSLAGLKEVGQLCSKQPSTATLEQWILTFPSIKRDFRLGADPLSVFGADEGN